MEGAATKVHIPIRGYRAAVRLQFSGHSSSPTILALHGFTGSGDDFGPLREAIGTKRVNWICPDFMGHGASASPAVLDPYTLPAVLELVDRARQLAPDPDKLVLLGYSMGGRIALQYLRWAKPLPAILIGASHGLEDPAERLERRMLDRKWVERLLQCTEGSRPMESFGDAWEAQPLIEPQTRLPEPVRSQIAGRRRTNDPVGLAHSLLACGTGVLPALWDVLPKLPPVTLVHGEWDNKFAAVARAMAGLNPRFRTLEVPSSGHAPHLENSLQCASSLSLILAHISPQLLVFYHS